MQCRQRGICRRAVDETVSAFGRMDVLVNNAGTDGTCAIEELSFEQCDRLMRANLYGPFFCPRSAHSTWKETSGTLSEYFTAPLAPREPHTAISTPLPLHAFPLSVAGA